MVLVCANCPFSSIATMDMRWGQLIINALASNVVNKQFGGFIVQDL
jgi:hypothetical protein